MYQQIQDLVREHGTLFYPITFVWAFFEGETFLIFAGFFAATHDFLHLWGLILCAGFGTTLGDFCFFLLGRHYGTKMVAKMPRLAKGQGKVVGWLEKHDVLFILLYRFLYGIRNISAIAIGTSKIKWQRYFFLNFIGAFIWAVSFAYAGYLFGDLFVGEGESPIDALMIGGLILFLIVMAVRYYLRRRAARAAALEPKL
jgi:membrane protein DedA with SNARE-associated domain